MTEPSNSRTLDGPPARRSLRKHAGQLCSRWKSVLGLLGVFAVTFAVAMLADYAGLIVMKSTSSYLATCCALLVAAYQHDQAREMQKHLITISSSIATQYCGEFPHFMPEIVRKMREAENNVTIMCDIPGYGHYSRPDDYELYRAAIVDLVAKKKTVDLTVYSEKRAQDALDIQFSELPTEDNSAAWAVFRAYEKRRNESISDVGALRKSLAKQNEEHVDQFEKERLRSMDRVDKAMPVYFWIVDDKEAIFSFAGLRVKPSSVAFRTVDPKLIEIFKRILHDVKNHVPVASSARL